MVKQLCNQPAPVKRPFAPNINPNRKKVIMSTLLKWANGTEIKYMFIEGAEKQKKVVRSAFKKWKSLGIGLSFKEVDSIDESMVRIGFDYDDGSWSYVGRDILTIPKKERTMNFGWDLADAYGMTTALHEIGHTLGFQHEHQSPFSGITWDSKAVIKEFAGPPNEWSKRDIQLNILDKLPANKVQGTKWDPSSIMEYEFSAGLIQKPTKYRTGLVPPGTISKLDISKVREFYPPVRPSSYKAIKPNKPLAVRAKSGTQTDFVFTASHTKSYTFETKGDLDTVMVISELDGNKKHYMSGDDDSGFDKNSKIKLPTVKGRSYLINIKVTYAPQGKAGSLLIM